MGKFGLVLPGWLALNPMTKPTRKKCGWQGYWPWLWILLGLWSFVSQLRGAEWAPRERADQAWKVASLVEDGGLDDLNVFNLDFERNTNSPRWGTAWVATSDGLHEYDGYTWRRHGRAEGLPSDFVRCVRVTRAGLLWVGTDQGAGVYDGRTFRTLGAETNLAGPNVRRITEDSEGTLWFCSDSWPNAGAGGGLTSLRDGQWKAYREADGLPSGYVVNYFRDHSGRQFAATLKGLAEFAAGRWRPAFSPATEGPINWGSGCLAETAGTGLLFSTGREVFRLQDGAWRQLPAIIPHEHGIAATADGGTVAVGRPNKGQSVFLEWSGDRWVPASAEFATPRGYTEDIQVAPDGSVWVAGYGCLVRWARQGSQWREFGDLPPPKLMDSQGGMWFAQTRGIFTPGGPTVRLFQGRWEPLGDAYDELVSHRQDNSVWGGTTNRLTRWRGTNRTDFTTTQTGLALYVAGEGDARGSFWLFGVDPQGNPATARHFGNQWLTRPVPELAGLRPWRETASSSNGLWVVGDRGAGTDAVLVRVTPTGNLRLDAPAQQVGTLGMKFREDRYGAVWLYGDAGLFRWVPGKSTRWDSIGDLPSRSVVSCVERGDELWFGFNGATGGRSALVALRSGQWTHFPVATLGNLTLADDGTLLADGVGQIFRIANQPGAVPMAQQLRTSETVNSVVQDLAGNLWVGAGETVFQFRSHSVPLRLGVAGPGRVHDRDVLAVTAMARDRFRPRGTRLGAVFASRLDDGEWSPLTQENEFKLDPARLKVGMHRLEVIAQDAAGNRRSEPAVHRFEVVAVPLQERVWFVPGVLGVAGLMTALGLFALHARRQLAGYARTLESRVAERTSELEQDIRRREAVEASLRASEERFALLFQSGPVLAAVVGLPDGRLLDVNRQFCTVFGFTRDEVIGRTTSGLGLWQRLEQRDEILAQIRAVGAVHNHEVRARTRTGKPMFILLSAERVYLAGGPAVLVFGADITARREAEEARLISEERLRIVTENVRVGLATVDRDRRYEYANPAYAEIVGRPLAAVVGAPVSRILAEIYERVVAGWLDRAFAGERVAFEAAWPTWAGERYLAAAYEPIVADGAVVRVVAVITDVTERRRAAAALQASEDRLRMVTGNARVGLVMLDQERRYTYANAAYAEMLGLPSADLVGQRVAAVQAPIYEGQIRPKLDLAFAGERVAYELRRPATDGDHHYAVRYEPAGTGGSVTNVVVVITEITDRKRAEVALRESEARFATAFNANPVIIVITTYPEGRYVDVNEAFLRVFGFRRDEVLGRRSRDLGIWPVPEQREAIIRQLAEGKPVRGFECLQRTRGGQLFAAEAFYDRIVVGNQDCILAINVDITERKRAEEARRASEARYRALFDYAPDGILIGDAQSTYLDANESMCRMLGYTHDELVGMNATDIIAPDEVQLIEPTIGEIARRSDHHREWHFRRKDGSLIPVDVRATQTPDGNFLGLVRDLTDRKEAEAALRAKDELLRLVIDLVPHFIFAKDRESRFLFANRAVADSVGLSPDQLVGLNSWDLRRDPAEAEAFLRDDQEVIASGKPKFVPAETLTDVHGRVRIHQTTKIPFRVPGTDEPALLGVAVEITEQQRMERLLEWEMKALERLLSNASLGELLHELAVGVEQHAPGALCSILLLDEEGVRLRHGAGPSLPDAYNRVIDGIAIGPSVGSCGTAAATGRQVIVTDIAQDPLWADFRALALAHGLRACWSTPIAGNAGHILGTFTVYYREPHSPGPAELALVGRVQHLAGLAIERKRAEESLQMTRLSVDRAGDSIFWVGRDGRIHYANEAACASRGFSREELLGMSIFDLDPDYQPGVWTPHFEELKKQGSLTLETRHRTKDGRLFPIEVNANYVFVRGQELNFCFVRDITARRRAERRRDLEHRVSRILAESVSTAVATPKILEAIGTSEGWKFGELWKVDGTDGRLFCRQSWSVSGLKVDELQAESQRLRFGLGEGLPGTVFQSGEVTVIPDVGQDARFVRAKAAAAAGLVGAVAFPLRADGPIAGVIVFLSDRRMEVDAELAETLGTLGQQVGQFKVRQLVQEELLRFVALSPSVIYALRITPTGLRAYWVSDNVFALTGYHPSESIHENWWADNLHPEDRDRVLGQNPGATDADHQVLEFRFRRKDGTYISLRDEKRVRRDATGNPVEIIGAWTDITDRVSLEKQLRQAQKMEAIGQLSGGIAHDFNNLLGAVIGNAQLATMDLAPEHPVAECLDQILAASRRATHLVQQILTFARQDRSQRHRVNPVPIVEESVRLLRATLPAGVHLTLIKGERLPAVVADETQMQQVLVNLCTNAWHAFEGGPGRISVELTAVAVEAEAAARSPDLQPGPYLRIRVEDTGKGMDAGTLERIFEPFFTTKEVGKGTGLGLSVVHGIIKAHGGAITVRSAVGVGTTFDLFLPAATAEVATAAPARETPLRLGHGEQLLLVDDQPEMLRTNRRELERLGYQVTAFADSIEALARFGESPGAFALLLTDLNMPGMNGVELTRAVLKLRPDLPVILTSGFITEDLRLAALAAGVREVLRKPALLQELGDAIANQLSSPP